MNREELKSTAQALATRGKGILAVDESTGTVGKRLAVSMLKILRQTVKHTEVCCSPLLV